VLSVLTLLVTPIVWPHYYVVLVMPIVVVVAALLRLAGRRRTPSEAASDPAAEPATGASRASLASTGLLIAGDPSRDPSVDPDAAAARAAENRRRFQPVLVLIALAVATAFLANAHYVEPFRRVGGQQLAALLVVYGAALIALSWSARGQGVHDENADGQGVAAAPDGVSPAAAR
jgi:hypothetical protein